MNRLLLFFFILTGQSSYLSARQSTIALVVTPGTSLYHRPLQIEATGFEPGKQVTMQVNAIDSEGNKWTSKAVFVTDNFGMVNPTKSESISGSYKGVHPSGTNPGLLEHWKLVQP